MTEDKYCDYCGEVIYIADKYFVHNGLQICEDCTKAYALMVFEQEADVRRAQSAQLIVCDYCEE